jgi:type IV pilus assembly protein PilY1
MSAMTRSAIMKVRVSAVYATVVSLGLLAGRTARAQQVDTNPPLPNVLILLDTSGSMERMIDGSLPESTPANTCNCDPGTGVCNWNLHPSPNRFGVVQQAFTGTLTNGYNCAAMPRGQGTVFASEYQINGQAPYDIGYGLPYHRPIAKDTTASPTAACVFAPGALPGANSPSGVGPNGVGSGGNATDFPPTAIVNHTYGIANTTSCTFAQNADGALDTMRDIMRFGLMTFDQDPGAGIGVTSGNSPQVASNPFDGMWSYFPNWNNNGTCNFFGNPVGCDTPIRYAVGARNPAAPPWEGRMIPFPATYDITAQENNASNVQKVISSTRPYGATPLAGMFIGAQYYFFNDPTGPQVTDPYVQGGCRNQYIVLITDGAPNFDMRPQCSASSSGDADAGVTTPAGVCPFPLPEDTAQALYTATAQQKVTTYVIGFAVSSIQDPNQASTVYCSSLVANGTVASVCNGKPDPKNPSNYDACCELQKIAVAGGSNHAYFADTPGDLQNALGSILASIAQNTTTRTTPAYSPVVSSVALDPNNPNNIQTNDALYLASFNPSPGLPWSGDIIRQRYVCNSSLTVPAPNVQKTMGDDFAANLNSNSGPVRTFIAFQPDSTPAVDSSTTIRPYVSSSPGDGIAKYGVTTYVGNAPTVIPHISTDALKLPTSCPYTSTQGGAAKSLIPTECRDMVLDFVFAQQSFGDQPDFPFVSRYTNALGDIYHAMPVVVGPPGSLLQDAAYVGFRAAYQNRKQVVYVATNDGLLHAFWADETSLENNELWALMPPAVMPGLLSTFPSSHQFLLDGSPVVRDVIWDRSIANAADSTVWHTMLVAGYGPYGQGYYAVDVTNPDPSKLTNGSVPNDPPAPGPTLRWQLTKMPATNAPLFGAQSATPAITTLFFDPGDGNGAREIGVAILPGGQNTGPTSSALGGPSCARAPKSTDSAPLNGYTARTNVRCWGSTQAWTDPVVGRSLSIARLDTGEIMRVFMRKSDLTNYPGDTVAIAHRMTDTPLDSPITGTPIVYPSDVGTDTTKVFVGDADGTVWRFDLSSPDPTQWVGELYLDLYNGTVDTNSTAWSDGQPLEVTPVVSLDTSGQLVMNIATGTTETYNSTGLEYVYSVTEKVQVLGTTSKLRSYVNWWLGPPTFAAGERVSGPMTVFDGTFYFATYAAAAPGSGSPVCAGGNAHLWGRDFVIPDNTSDLSQGGKKRLQRPPPNIPQPTPPVFVTPSDDDQTLLGKVIPGVSIKSTPACASTTSGSDYVPGTHQAVQNFNPGGYSLFTQVGSKSTSGAGGARTFETSLPTPVAPTVIDSWAAVLD